MLSDLLVQHCIFVDQIEAIMNDFIQLNPQSNVYEAETMVEGWVLFPRFSMQCLSHHLTFFFSFSFLFLFLYLKIPNIAPTSHPPFCLSRNAGWFLV